MYSRTKVAGQATVLVSLYFRVLRLTREKRWIFNGLRGG